MTSRTPQEVLADLGRELERASAQRPRMRVAHVVVLVALAMLAIGGTALATRSIWADDAPSTAKHGPTAAIASGSLAGVRWALAARRCPRGEVSVVLRLRDGGAAGACGPAGRAPATYLDPVDGRAYAFGTVPRNVDEVSADGLRGPLVHAPSEVERRAGLPRGIGYYVVAVNDPTQASRSVQFTCAQARCGS